MVQEDINAIPWEMDTVIQDIIANGEKDFTFCHVKRSADRVAAWLAQHEHCVLSSPNWTINPTKDLAAPLYYEAIRALC